MRTFGEVDSVIAEIRTERNRQISGEGWGPEHDDIHTMGEIADAAACYAMTPTGKTHSLVTPKRWPWATEWWKPKDRRRDLVRAAALIVAEIERLDRNRKPTVAAIMAAGQ